MPTFKERMRSPIGLTVAGAILFAFGGAAGSAVTRAAAPIDVMAPGAPTPIAQLPQAAQPWAGPAIVTARGRIAEIYGGQFVLADATGRVLVEAGRAVEQLAANQEVTVQGGYRDGVIRARYLVGPDGRVVALGGRRGPGGRHGGPDGRHDGAGGDRRGGPPLDEALDEALVDPSPAPQAAPANAAAPAANAATAR